MMRCGGLAVCNQEGLRRDLEQMKAAGIGGVEIATPIPLALDDQRLASTTTLLSMSTSKTYVCPMMKRAGLGCG